jgi:hypothetical protein
MKFLVRRGISLKGLVGRYRKFNIITDCIFINPLKHKSHLNMKGAVPASKNNASPSQRLIC